MSRKNDYTRYSRESAQAGAVEVAEKVREEITPTETIEEREKEPVIGVVTDCVRLNVRENPNSNSLVVAVIDASTELAIIEEESTKDFFKVCTPAGLEGFCMKRYITIMP